MITIISTTMTKIISIIATTMTKIKMITTTMKTTTATHLFEFPKKEKNGKILNCEGSQNWDELLKLCKLSNKGSILFIFLLVLLFFPFLEAAT